MRAAVSPLMLVSGESGGETSIAEILESPMLRDQLSAIDYDRCAGHIAAGIGGEQQQHTVEIALLAEPAEGNIALDSCTAFAGEIITVQIGDDPARRYGIDANAFCGELQAERLGELDYARLCHRIGGHALGDIK